MTSNPPLFRLPGAPWSLHFDKAAHLVLGNHVQHRRRSRESVGQLFSRNLVTNDLVIEEATVLRPVHAAWATVSFDVQQAMAEREVMFQRGLHCIGLWHTHPETRPEPSPKDRALARDHALSARPQLDGFVFVIVGTQPYPAGLWVGVDDGTILRRAELHAH